jgi:predicted nucleic acid-binding protein
VIVVDTSVWVDHLRRRNERLATLLVEGQVLSHPFVVGELACGHLRQRAEILGLLARLPPAPLASHDETLRLLDSRSLMGRGLGWIDLHLLASAVLAREPLWTADRRLDAAALAEGIAWRP